MATSLPLVPRSAASVVVLRPGSDWFEVLLVERGGGGTFENLVVFPGGSVDELDHGYAGHAGEDAAARVAALRELAEETGLLSTGGQLVGSPPLRDAHFYHWLDEEGLSLDTGSLVLISRWVTPEVMPYRFDTRFYLLVADHTPEVIIDQGELAGHAWETPRSALARVAAGDWQMILPTLAHLRWLAKRPSMADAVSSARGADGRTLISPRVLADGSLVPVHLPAEQS